MLKETLFKIWVENGFWGEKNEEKNQIKQIRQLYNYIGQ